MATQFVFTSSKSILLGIITTVTTFVLENFDDEELKNIGNICKQVFLIFPHYCLGRGLIDMATESGLNAVIGQFGKCFCLLAHKITHLKNIEFRINMFFVSRT